jgi:TonB-dependent SusC/RagA subfamily outer membrane receptor
MIITWMLYSLLVGALVAAAAAGMEAVFRLGGLPLRWLWSGALLLALALVALAPAREPARPAFKAVEVIPSAAPAIAAASLPDPGLMTRFAATARDLIGRARGALGEVGRRSPHDLGRYLLLAWGAASALALLAIGATHHRFRRDRRRWPAAELQGLRVRVAPQIGPAVMGVTRPEIVIPRWFLDLSPAESRLVLTHESEHVRARDPLLLALGWMVAALLAWNPAAWWMLARLRLAVELDCDTRVLRRGESPHSYGAVLIDLAGRSSRLPVGMLALADPPSQLERRLLAMTYRRTHSALARGVALGALALAALLAACAAELPTAAEIQAIDVASAEQAGTRIALLDDGDAIYRLDGVIVAREEALALTADKIGSIGVVKSQTPGGRAEIAILSRKAGDPVLTGAGYGTVSRAQVRGVTPAEGAVSVGQGTIRIRGTNQQGPEPLYLVDGVRQANGLRDLAPNTIESMHVIKDRDAAVKLAGPDAVNGLVVIRTKGGKPDGLDLEGAGAEAPMRIQGVVPTSDESQVFVRGAETQMRIRGVAQYPGESRVVVRGLVSGAEPLYIVDGVPRTGTASANPLSELDPGTIESITVLKDRSATEVYGARGGNGVVIITTRKPAP